MHFEENQSQLSHFFANFLTERSALEADSLSLFNQLILDLCLSIEGGHSCLQIDDEQKTLLERTPIVSGDATTPLVITGHRLYLQKYFLYEKELAAHLNRLARKTYDLPDDFELKDRINRISGFSDQWQVRAVKTALEHQLSIISGGPGTGKTTTVMKILQLLVEVYGSTLSIALAAPTGKAAMRLKNSINSKLEELTEEQKLGMPCEAFTLHRLLKAKRGGVSFHHNRNNRLSWDVVVVDEASMIDLSMMSKLVESLADETRLILLGDKDQLASVEAGAVLADCIRSLPEHTVVLQKSYRFNENIRQLSEAVLQSTADTFWHLLTSEDTPDISLIDYSPDQKAGECYLDYMQQAKCFNGNNQKDIFDTFHHFQLLSPLKGGPQGTRRLNRGIEKFLSKEGLCSPESIWYAGRPVIIMKNEYNLQLFNGDIGICLNDPDTGISQVWFEDGVGGYFCLPPHRLPPHETVFAMTIHKSQGSEFNEVLVVMPEEDNRILSRELLYTGITRAKENVWISGRREILRSTIERSVERFSGLQERILMVVS